MSKALVTKRYFAAPMHPWMERNWIARHECADGSIWKESLTEWHNAFWAADHHVRYDCGRREQVSSGGYIPPGIDTGKREPTITVDGREYYTFDQRVLADRDAYELRANLAWHKARYEGGMRKDPTPSDMDIPQGGESTEVNGAWYAGTGATTWEDLRGGRRGIRGQGYGVRG
jgi:hypothetical protein